MANLLFLKIEGRTIFFMVSDQELIKILLDEYERTGCLPLPENIDRKDEILNRFKTWNKALRIAGITRYPNKEELIEMIKKWTKEHGKPPTMYTFSISKNEGDFNCNIQSICKRLNVTWEGLLEEAGVTPIKKFCEMTDDEILDIVRKEIDRIGSCKVIHYKNNKSPLSPSISYIAFRFGRWNDMLKRLNIRRENPLSKEDVLQLILDLHKETKRTPTIKMLIEKGCGPNLIVKHFGSYENALKEINLTPNVVRKGKSKYSSNRKKMKKEEIEQLFLTIQDEIGEVPKIKQLNDKGCSSYFIIKYFGSYDALIQSVNTKNPCR